MRITRTELLLAATLAALPLSALASPPPSDWQNAPVCNGKYSAQMKHTFYQTATTAGVRTEAGVARNPFAQGSFPAPSYYLAEAEVSSRSDAHPDWVTDAQSRDGYDSYSSEPAQVGTVVFKNAGCKLVGTARVSVQCPGSAAIETKTFTRTWDGCGL
ncbi:hypothetical protein J5226_13345 [Lysobacter sp. K5869]|uniref:hypothetical protein n=1 Tax=Lysobacter sp. K5869 TaxID=2820808 RepID=UPI001C0641BA|nr:hypothetical protein [Lysobacter sp. K5869]QWP74676.1 hypothetical protein J5226_13345 [Lysobacter sp. K5869]